MTKKTNESQFAVRLHGQNIGRIIRRDEYTRFFFEESYLSQPDRNVLGLRFEDSLSVGKWTGTDRLPEWFSNLLPEGKLREFIAEEQGVNSSREMTLLERVGHDLPGAVTVLQIEAPGDDWQEMMPETPPRAAGFPPPYEWRFSLAGVALKFSMLREEDRLTVPAAGLGGDWIVKLPDQKYPLVPRNEYAMMKLAAAAGIEVPEVLLVHRDDVQGLPDHVWNDEEFAYAIRRFDRKENGSKVHIEDFAQVRGFYPEKKYESTFETLASLVYRRRDEKSLAEFVRRLTFNIIVGNGDAHLKNWSLIYNDGRVPELAPAYDLVATFPYRTDGKPEITGMKFRGSKDVSKVTASSFDWLARRLDTRLHLSDIARQTAAKVSEVVDLVADCFPNREQLLSTIVARIATESKRFGG